MKTTIKTRHKSLIRILSKSNCFESIRFLANLARGRQQPSRLVFDDIPLLIRPGSPDLKVIRRSLRGEFDAAMSLVETKHDFIVDAGGYIGTAAIVFAMRFPKARIVCLEPSSENFAIARRNCEPWKNIEVLQCALAAIEDRVALNCRGTGPWGYTITSGKKDEQSIEMLEEVDTVTIPSLLKRYGASGIDLLKLDIEGAEFDLLKNRPAWVNQCGVIVAEMHDRFVPGATRTFFAATEGRADVWAKGEKLISVLKSE